MELNLLEEYNGMSPEQKQLVDDLFLAIRLSDNDKIKQAKTKHFETDDWLEEEATPNYPSLTVKPDGLGHYLYINDKCCLIDNFEP